MRTEWSRLNSGKVEAPKYLAADLKEKFNKLAVDCEAMGTLTRLDADILAKYVLAENEYLIVSKRLQLALAAGDYQSADRWVNLQEKLTKQCLTLGAELGLTPNARRTKGLFVP